MTTPKELIRLIDLPLIIDEGKLCFAEGNKHLPFGIERFYFIADVDEGAVRGLHAHHKTKQVLFCIRGSVQVILDDGVQREGIVLSEPNQGVILDPMIWHEMLDFSKDALLLVAASEPFEEADYIRDYETFLSLARGTK